MEKRSLLNQAAVVRLKYDWLETKEIRQI